MGRFTTFLLGAATSLGLLIAGATHATANQPMVALPAAQSAATAFSAATTAAAAASTGIGGPKFCGYDIRRGANPDRIRNLRSVHDGIMQSGRYEWFARYGGNKNGNAGHVLWGYHHDIGFDPLYFAPDNVPSDFC